MRSFLFVLMALVDSTSALAQCVDGLVTRVILPELGFNQTKFPGNTRARVTYVNDGTVPVETVRYMLTDPDGLVVFDTTFSFSVEPEAVRTLGFSFSTDTGELSTTIPYELSMLPSDLMECDLTDNSDIVFYDDRIRSSEQDGSGGFEDEPPAIILPPPDPEPVRSLWLIRDS